MKLEQSEYTGITSEKYDFNSYVLSIVNFQTSAPEDWHHHENTHLSLVLQGGSRESRKKEEIQLTPGKIILYNEGELHSNRYTAFPSKHLIVELKKDFHKTNSLSPKHFSTSNTANIDIYLNLLNIYNELHLGDIYSAETIDFSFNQLLKSDQNSSYIPVWMNSLREVIEDRWDEFIPLKDLATIFNVHTVTISRYFKKYYKCTLGDYMRKIKVERAVFFLLNTNKSISEISDICGFTDQSHMIKVFKLYIGFLPNQFRSI
ncbi:helix-turn-helix transcriptional regulator [Aquimarina sp. TRL1]|uniref:helix-turn-helix domain-containing protein n=1 Tax=Aquimarina sp. (strain TRL1) TaxID=2736252 RepID=UPI00158D6C2D|nr:helix-turn-helix domain-containing protein [Aquimarina sp. TRL1]QKX05847.1 helix-turn-helix transcriptional regulator [Aquimarina sp. TRL1]